MRVPKNRRNEELTSSSDFSEVDEYLKSHITSTHLPRYALILDEDVKKSPHVNLLRKEDLRFQNGRGSINPRQRVSVASADDLFSSTEDRPLLKWCHSHGYQLMTCNVQDFQQLNQSTTHSGLMICSDQSFTHQNPSVISNKIDAVYNDNKIRQVENTAFEITPY